jgi:hypothetical protein
MSEKDLAIELLKCLAINKPGFLWYVSTPITTGLPYYELRYSLGGAEVPTNIRKEIVQPKNVAAAKRVVQKLRANHYKVIDPTCLEVDGWGHKDYMSFWDDVIRKLRPNLVMVEGWEYSTGSVDEFRIADDCGIPAYFESAEPGARMERKTAAKLVGAAVNHLEKTWKIQAPELKALHGKLLEGNFNAFSAIK